MKDIIWLGWARVIGIFLVVFGHVSQRIPLWQENITIDIWNWIYLFHMPLFFVISGYLYKQGDGNNLRKIFWSLLVPYLIYQLLFPPFQVAGIWRLKVTDESISCLIAKHLCGILLGDGYNTPISYHNCLPCWFIVCIIQLRLLFSYVKINKVSIIVLTIAAILFLYIRKMCGFDLYACIDSTIMAVPYFMLGHWLRNSTPSNNIVRYIMGGVKIRYSIA